MRRSRRRAALGLRPLLAVVDRPFDQTNGVIPAETALPHEANSTSARLVATGVAANAITFGFFGGGF